MKQINRLGIILNQASPNWLSFLLFGGLFFFGILNFDDYGISWDEKTQRNIGSVSAIYVVYGNRAIDTFHDADYGVGLETPLFLFEKVIGLEESDHVYKMRHLVSHLFFLICLYFGYCLIFQMFGNAWLAAIGVLLVVLNPQFYAHSFFNTKDIPFMSMFFVSFFLIFKSFRHYRYLYFILAGASIGFMVNLRIMGIMLFGLVLFFVVADIMIKRRDKGAQRKTWQCLMLFILSFWAVLYFSWPYLYENPLAKIGTVFANMSKFRWQGSVLYFGEVIEATELPWHYAIVWFGITTPIVYILLGITGFILAVYHLLHRPKQWLDNNIDRHLIIYMVCLVAPVLAVIVLKSVLYDGWRHLYFIYPAFVMITVYGIQKIRKKWWKIAVYTTVVLSFIAIGSHMVANHPNQHVYFNELVNRKESNHERKLFELDYWGVSYRQGLEEILRQDSSQTIKVHCWNPPGKYNLAIIPKDDRERIHLTEEDPDYFITAYRGHPENYQIENSREIYSVNIQGNTVLSVFKLKDGDVVSPVP